MGKQKKREGFTLFEVLVAFALFATFLALMLRQQIVAIDRLSWGRQHMTRMFYVKEYLVRLLLVPPAKRPKPKELGEPLPSMKIVSDIGDISHKSSLKEFRGDIMRLKVTGRWRIGTAQAISMISFAIKPPQKKK